MRQFNTPPGWPDPPNARWRPPKRWGPAESWPSAPAGWRFWVDEDGRPVRGPIGRYGGPSIVRLGAGAAVVLALIGLVLFNPFTGNDSTPTASVETTTPAEGTPTAPETVTPTTEESARASTPTPEPSPTPAESKSSTPEPSTPRPSATPTTTSTPRPTPTPTGDPTTAPAGTTTTTAVVYRNCAEARTAGKAPLHRGDPGYSEELDNNGDGIACDRGNS